MEVVAKTSACWTILVCVLGTRSQAVLIESCNDGFVTVQEGSKYHITCSDIYDPFTVTWSIQTSVGSNIFQESCRTELMCNYENGITITAGLARASLLTIREDHRMFDNLRVICNDGQSKEYGCNIRVESAPNYSDCKFYDDGSLFSGHCNMNRAFRSNTTVYSCQWSIVFTDSATSDGWSIPSALVYTAYEESTLLYYKGVCYFSYPRPVVNVTLKLDGSMISQEFVAHINNDFQSTPEQNTTFTYPSVELDAVNPLNLVCSGQPGPVQAYEWSGVVCAQGNQKLNVCSAFTSDLTLQQPLVTCTVTSANTMYNGSRIIAKLYLQVKYATTSTAVHAWQRTTAHLPATPTKATNTTSDHRRDETTIASDHTINSGKRLVTDSDEKGDALPWGAIGGGVGAGVIIIIIVVFVIFRTRAAYDRPRRREDMSDPYTGLSPPGVVDSTTVEPYEDVGGYQNQMAIDMSTYDHPNRGHEKDTYTALVPTASTIRPQDESQDVAGYQNTAGRGRGVDLTPAPQSHHTAKSGVQQHVYQITL